MLVKFTLATRKHRLGRARILSVMAAEPIGVDENERGEARYSWVALDDRGLELEVIAVETVDVRSGETILLVIHAMPTALRGRG